MQKKKLPVLLVPVLTMLIGSLFVGCIMNQNGKDELVPGKDEKEISGSVVDENNAPLAGVRVSINGVTAGNLTDAGGRFSVSVPAKEITRDLLVCAGKAGYAPFYGEAVSAVSNGLGYAIASTIRLESYSESLRDHLRCLLNDAEVEIGDEVAFSPIAVSRGTDNRQYVKMFCDFRKKIKSNNIMILIDASGSTNQVVTGSNGVSQTIYETEIEAAKHFVNLYKSYQIGIIRFAKNAQLVLAPTLDGRAVIGQLDAMKAVGPEKLNTSEAGTDYSEALSLAFKTLGVNKPAMAHRQNFVMMLSDGIPTLPVPPGITQELDDRLLPLQIAKKLQEHKVVAYTYAIGIPEDVAELTTLPGIADITGGIHYSITRPVEFAGTLSNQNLLGVKNIEIRINNTLKAVITPQPDGSFSFEFEITSGKHSIQIVVNRYDGWGPSESADFSFTMN